MSKIFCLMGKSSCGKDTIFKELINESDLALKPIVLYTTRPKRVNEIDGVEYHFINAKQLKHFEDLGKVIEVRKYNTVHGEWCYATIDDGQFNFNSKNYITIITLEAYKSLRQYFGQEAVFPIYIDMEDGVRLERALSREQSQGNPNYKEMCRRFLADDKDFSKVHLDECNIEKSYLNYKLNECTNEIITDIKKNI